MLLASPIVNHHSAIILFQRITVFLLNNPKYYSGRKMKYKRLSVEELQALQMDFVNFLASMQITAADWEKMKKEKNEEANLLIDVFSDMVYDKVLNKISYLEFRDEKTLNIFYFGQDTVKLIGLRVKEGSKLNLMVPDVMEQWNESNQASVNIVRSERNYQKEKQLEIFELLQTGCLITDDKLFKTLNSIG
jgi:cag pathogenicity island protein 24